MPFNEEPIQLTSHAASRIDRLESQAAEHQRLADETFEIEVPGARGEVTTIAEAQQLSDEISSKIQREEANGSRRHRLVAPWVKRTVWIFTGIIDFPIMLWFTSSVFNVDWANPVGLPLLLSFVVSLLPTAGSAFALYEIGHHLRDHKTHDRDLRWSEIPVAARSGLVSIGILLVLLFLSLSVRIFIEGRSSGEYQLSPLLAILVAFVVLVTNALVFWTAFSDGSLDQDDLRHYSKILLRYFARKREHEHKAERLRAQIWRIRRQAERDHSYTVPAKSAPLLQLGFSNNSSELPPGTQDDIERVVADISNECGNSSQVTEVTVIGYTADPPDATVKDCHRLSVDRADAVAQVLDQFIRERALPVRIERRGGGIAPASSSIIDGHFDESRAASMRRVEVRYKE